jgi:hypothetical protein
MWKTGQVKAKFIKFLKDAYSNDWKKGLAEINEQARRKGMSAVELFDKTENPEKYEKIRKKQEKQEKEQKEDKKSFPHFHEVKIPDSLIEEGENEKVNK